MVIIIAPIYQKSKVRQEKEGDHVGIRDSADSGKGNDDTGTGDTDIDDTDIGDTDIDDTAAGDDRATYHGVGSHIVVSPLFILLKK